MYFWNCWTRNFSTLIFLGGVPWTQNSKFPVLSIHFRAIEDSFKSSLGKNIALYTSPTVVSILPLDFSLPGPFNFIFLQLCANTQRRVWHEQ